MIFRVHEQTESTLLAITMEVLLQRTMLSDKLKTSRMIRNTGVLGPALTARHDLTKRDESGHMSPLYFPHAGQLTR